MKTLFWCALFVLTLGFSRAIRLAIEEHRAKQAFIERVKNNPAYYHGG